MATTKVTIKETPQEPGVETAVDVNSPVGEATGEEEGVLSASSSSKKKFLILLCKSSLVAIFFVKSASGIEYFVISSVPTSRLGMKELIMKYKISTL